MSTKAPSYQAGPTIGHFGPTVAGGTAGQGAETAPSARMGQPAARAGFSAIGVGAGVANKATLRVQFLNLSSFLLLTAAAARRLTALLAASALLLAVACQKDGEIETLANDFGALPLVAPAPADNPTTTAKAALGRALFWDPILSGGRDVSCASCHHPATAYADGIDLAIGANGLGTGAARHFAPGNDIPLGQRNTPTILNAAFNGLAADGSCDPVHAAMFWDSRVESLETQALLPITMMPEMRGRAFTEATAVDSVVARLRGVGEYQQLFATAFGGSDPVTRANLGKALACFERTMLATDAPFDRYMRGDKAALSTEQVRGLNAFIQSGCNKCHGGPMLSDYKTHVVGFPDNFKNNTPDKGKDNTFAFRTPSLRNVALTAPYGHGGAVPDLEAVLRVYDPGPGGPRPGNGTANPSVSRTQLDPLFPGRVTDVAAITAFLESLTDASFDRTVPAQVPSGLRVGGN